MVKSLADNYLYMKFESLRSELKRQIEILNPLLISEDGWKRSHYLLMEELISTKLKSSPLMTDDKRASLGITISHMTLKRFFEKKYDRHTTDDLRFLKTVEKLCIFMGFANYSSFFEAADYNDLVQISDDSSAPAHEFFEKFLSNFLKAQFEYFKGNIVERTEPLVPYVFEESPFYTRLIETLKNVHERKCILLTEGNRSSYELITVKVLSLNTESCICETREYWNMVFKPEDSIERIVYNQNNVQTYFFKNQNGIWKLWNNHNPDYGRVVKEVEIVSGR